MALTAHEFLSISIMKSTWHGQTRCRHKPQWGYFSINVDQVFTKDKFFTRMLSHAIIEKQYYQNANEGLKMAHPVNYHYGKFPPQDIDWISLIPLIGPANAALASLDFHGAQMFNA